MKQNKDYSLCVITVEWQYVETSLYANRLNAKPVSMIADNRWPTGMLVRRHYIILIANWYVVAALMHRQVYNC